MDSRRLVYFASRCFFACRIQLLVSMMVLSLVSAAMANTARADIAVIVNTKNAANWDADSRAQVKDIFLGKLEKFPDGSAVRPIDQRKGAVRQEFYQKLTGKDETALNVYWSNLIFTGNGRPPKVIGDDNDVKKAVRENPDQIGYIDSKAVDDSVRVIYVLK